MKNKYTDSASKVLKELKSKEEYNAAHRPPRYTDPELMAWRLAEYIYIQAEELHDPLTINGMQRAVGLQDVAFREYQAGQKDHVKGDIIDETGRRVASQEGYLVDKYIKHYRSQSHLYTYMLFVLQGSLPPSSIEISIDDIMSLAEDTVYSQIIQNSRLLLNEDIEKCLHKGGIGDIMRAKVVLGWQDERHVVQRTEIASDEQAKRLADMGYVKQIESK